METRKPVSVIQYFVWSAFSGKFASLINDFWLKYLQWCMKQCQWQPYLLSVLGKHHGLSTTCQLFCFQNLLHISWSSPSWCVSVPAERACCDDKCPQNVADVAHVGDDGGKQWRRAGAGRRQRCYRWSGTHLVCVLHRSSVWKKKKKKKKVHQIQKHHIYYIKYIFRNQNQKK